MSVDYRDLLVRYIGHVFECEGSTFITTTDLAGSFTADEIAVLLGLEGEALAEVDE